MTRAGAPELEGDALAAVRHRGSHLQIIASAGSGKTEVVSQRVVDLLADGRAGAGHRRLHLHRAGRRGAEEPHRAAGRGAARARKPSTCSAACSSARSTPTASGCCSSTCRGTRPTTSSTTTSSPPSCSREANRLGIRQLDPAGRKRLFAAIEAFLHSVDVVENELLDPATMPEPFRTVLLDYLRHARAVPPAHLRPADRPGRRRARAAGGARPACTPTLRHLIVDEYQDVNPAQERLIELLTGPEVELCVVGDDDQAIYQWRGSDVANIVDFADRYPSVATLLDHHEPPQPARRSSARPTASPTLDPGAARQDDARRTGRRDGAPRSWCGTRPTSTTRPAGSRSSSSTLNEAGVAYRDIAVLVRGRAAYPTLVEPVRHVRHPRPARRPHGPVRAARSRRCSAGPSPGSRHRLARAASAAARR